MKFKKLQLLIIALVMFVATSSFAALSYNVNVDTSTLNGTDGYLYFQYVPVNADSADSTATVTSFTGGSLALARSAEVDGSAVIGQLPGSAVFANTNGINDYNQGITFGNSINFRLSFSDPSSSLPVGGSSTFSLGLFQDENGAIQLLSGTLFTIDLMNDGTTSPSFVANEATVNPVPIPGAVWLLGSGLAGLVGLRKKTRK